MLDLALLMLQPGGFWAVDLEPRGDLSIFHMVLISADLTLVLGPLRLRLAEVPAATFLSALGLLRFLLLDFSQVLLGAHAGCHDT